MQPDEDTPGEIDALFAIRLGIKPFLAHRPHRHVIGRDLALLAQEVVAAPGDLEQAENISAHPPIERFKCACQKRVIDALKCAVLALSRTSRVRMEFSLTI